MKTLWKRWFIPAVLSPVLLVSAGLPANAQDKDEQGRSAVVTAASGPKRAADAELITTNRKLTALAKAKGAVGVYYDEAGRGFVVLIPDSGPGSGLTAGDFRPADPQVRVKKSAVDRATLDAVGAMLRGRAFHPDAKKYTYAWAHNLVDDTLEVETNAPATVMAAVRGKFGSRVKLSYGAAGRQIRTNDPAPHWGGAAIVPAASTTVCTSGFAVQDAFGNRYMTTAGHCAPLYAGYNSPEGGQYWGLVVARAPFPAYDLELIGGSSYRGFIYVGDFFGAGTPVFGADDPIVGFSGYCRSGTITFEVCGLRVTSLEGQFCPPDGCTSLLIRYEGANLGRSGDSGAPFYVYSYDGLSVHARGSIVGSTDVAGYAERWSTISGYFGVGIVIA